MIRPRRPVSAVHVVALLAAACAAGGDRGATASRSSGPVCARIFSTNDTHGRLLPAEQSWSSGRLVGGSAAIAGYARRAARETPECPLFIVSGGDIMQGTLISNLTDGASTIEAFNAIGYDAAAVGNHEFDWGVDVLRQRIAQAEFAFLGANIYERTTGNHPAWVRPWEIVEKDGVRVGFVGMTTRSTPTTSRPINVVDFEFRSISAALDRYIPEVRAAGVDFVVAVMHEGGFCDGSGCRGKAIDALTATRERFDYAVTGHTHSPIEFEIDGAPVVQSYANTTSFGLGRIDRDAEGVVSARLIDVRPAYVDEVDPDPELTALVEGYRVEVSGVSSRVVTTLSSPISKPRRGDLLLGRLIADAQRAATGTQVALMNSGGIRRSLPAGDITYEHLFELQPFGNRLVTMRLSGELLLASLEHGMSDEGAEAQLSGVRVTYDPDDDAGSRIRSARLDDGTMIEPAGTYSVTVNDFMAVGGGGYTMFLEGSDIVETGIIDVDALVDYLEGRPRPLDVPRDRRWIAAGSG
ncbi:MAG: bifunctional UDP-sugar hydrolase/5'-nucleotidase [Gemmatimonadota bacterium]